MIYLFLPGKRPRVNPRASDGTWLSALTSANASCSGVLPSASTWTRSPVASSAMPRATVCLPSDRISTTSRATTGS